MHHWMHSLDKPPPMPFNMVATVMDNTHGQRIARASVIFKADVPSDHPQMEEYAIRLVESIEAVSRILDRPEHTLLLVTLGSRHRTGRIAR